MQFRTFWKKRWVSQPNYFRNYGLREGWLLKRLKGRASEDHAEINVLTSSKHCWNQQLLHHYYPIFPCIWDILSWKKSALVWYEMTTLFVNTFTAHNKYTRCNVHNFGATSSNAIISKIIGFLWTFYWISEMCMQFRTFWKKRWVSQPNYFRNYWLREGWLLKRLKGSNAPLLSYFSIQKTMSCFRRPCGNQRVNEFQTLLKSARHHYFPISPCIWDILSWKKSALVWSEMTTLFVNTLTAHNKYSRCIVHNFAQQVQTPLSQK